MPDLEKNYQQICCDLRKYCETYGREAGSVKLVAVGKKHTVEKIVALARLGQQDFGENFLQEAGDKILHCRQQTGKPESHINWHFIGHIQSRKCRDLAHYFDWIHTIETTKVARKLNQHRVGSPLNVLIQVNIDQEQTKSGVDPSELSELAHCITELPNLNLRGLMIIPRVETDFILQRKVFARCLNLLDDLNATGYNLDQLSMGMTNDMEAAIAEGATMVRIGTALFGPRPGT